ncbi:MAG: hypothetical protein ACKOEZ_07770 [Spartobacteria bacterium]
MKAALPFIVPLLLSACSVVQKPEPEIKRAQPKPQEIQIQTAPPGALVDWNGNVLGVAPITIELTPSFNEYASHYSWPSTGVRTQRFRARWPDGAINTEFFETNTPPPQAIAIVSPSVGNYRDIWTTPAKKELQIKKGP